MRYIEKVRKVVLIAGMPRSTTVHSSETSGTIAIAQAVHTRPVMRRSVAPRRPSTTRAQAGSATRKSTPAAITQAIGPQPRNSTGRAAAAAATTATRAGAKRGSFAAVKDTDCETGRVEVTVLIVGVPRSCRAEERSGEAENVVGWLIG